MKRWLCMVLALLVLCLIPVAAAGEGDLSLRLHAFLVEQESAESTLLHLLFYKEGNACYRMDEVMVQLRDGSDAVIEPASVEAVVFPLHHIPAGSHCVPVTLRCTHAENDAIVDVDILSVVGTETSAPGSLELSGSVPFLAGWGGDCIVMTAWTELPEGTNAEDCFATVIGLDSEGVYLGNGELKLGEGVYVAGADVVERVCASSGWTAEELKANGFVFDAPAYVLYERVPMPWLAETPSGFAIFHYSQLQVVEEPKVAMYMERIVMQEDGSFVIHGILQNMTGRRWQLDSFDMLLLAAADGSTALCESFTFDTPFRVMEAGEFLPYTIEGRAGDGFMADSFQLGYTVSPADASDHRGVKGGMTTPSFDSAQPLTLTSTMPVEEGIDPADCFVCVMFLDLVNNVYQGAVWTCANEAWVQDGEIRFPTMDAPDGADLTAALVTSYYVAE